MAFLRRLLAALLLPGAAIAVIAAPGRSRAASRAVNPFENVDSAQQDDAPIRTTVEGEELDDAARTGGSSHAVGPHPRSGGKEFTTDEEPSTDERQRQLSATALLEISEVPRGVGAPVVPGGGIGVATGPEGVVPTADTTRQRHNKNSPKGGSWKRSTSGLRGTNRARRGSLSPLFSPNKKETTSFLERFIRRPIRNLAVKFERWAHLNDGITSLLGPQQSRVQPPQQSQQANDDSPTGATSTLQKKSPDLSAPKTPPAGIPYSESDLQIFVIPHVNVENSGEVSIRFSSYHPVVLCV